MSTPTPTPLRSKQRKTQKVRFLSVSALLPLPKFVPYQHKTNPLSSPTAFAFNCAQRAHANFTEHHATAVASLLIAGLQFPLAAAACGFGWTLARAAYMVGYSRSSPETKGRGRYKGSAFWLFEAVLMGMAGYTGVKMVMGN